MQLALEKKERLSPSPCMHAASIWGEGKFCLDREFSKNAPYKQKIIFHLASSDKMEQKNFFFAWTVDRWYIAYLKKIVSITMYGPVATLTLPKILLNKLS